MSPRRLRFSKKLDTYYWELSGPVTQQQPGQLFPSFSVAELHAMQQDKLKPQALQDILEVKRVFPGARYSYTYDHAKYLKRRQASIRGALTRRRRAALQEEDQSERITDAVPEAPAVEDLEE